MIINECYYYSFPCAVPPLRVVHGGSVSFTQPRLHPAEDICYRCPIGRLVGLAFFFPAHSKRISSHRLRLLTVHAPVEACATQPFPASIQHHFKAGTVPAVPYQDGNGNSTTTQKKVKRKNITTHQAKQNSPYRFYSRAINYAIISTY